MSNTTLLAGIIFLNNNLEQYAVNKSQIGFEFHKELNCIKDKIDVYNYLKSVKPEKRIFRYCRVLL